jgi:hypothetical protein
MCRVRRRQQISNEEDHQKELDDRSNRIILMAVLNVADQDSTAWHFLESLGDMMQTGQQASLHLVVEERLHCYQVCLQECLLRRGIIWLWREDLSTVHEAKLRVRILRVPRRINGSMSNNIAE